MHAGFPGSQNPFPTRSPAYHKGTHPPPGPGATSWLLTGFTWSQGTLSARPFHLKPWLPSLGESAPHPPPLPASVQALHPASHPLWQPNSPQAPQLHIHTPSPALPLLVPSRHNSHVLGDWRIADSVGGGWDAGLTAVAATAAVQTGHVHSVKAVVCLPWPRSSVLFSILIWTSAGRDSGTGSVSLLWGANAWQGHGLVNLSSEMHHSLSYGVLFWLCRACPQPWKA